ncbi:chemotaxis protein CheW [Megalodesulfovibrio gigas]|uniref:Putative chemotaxis protein CheW n=1 Tax=Megalodesulfovibrio gigas (strain ATCC 19364 / DSM 1382 / NCIMB 9332 / VKM B-1759) TaxID=1121448 RepID=T2GC77_MEGG1|nr:chemotaxis protein CheW [Megalodesulfovibrio gigas]AGW13721.1 putative chemotaxis protein CheW [Megalodesulfovibrio gigas DSM 1382 = ATCC 19364]
MSTTLCLLTSDADAVLARRARELARPAVSREQCDRVAVQEMLFFALGDQAFAVDTRFVLGAGHVHHLLPLPGTPAFIAGVMLWEGRILAVNSLAQLLGLQSGQSGTDAEADIESDRGRLVVAMHGPDVEAPRLELLFEVDALLGVGGLAREALPGGALWRAPPPAAGRLGTCRRAVVQAAMVRDLASPPSVTTFLDMHALLTDPALQPGAHA